MTTFKKYDSIPDYKVIFTEEYNNVESCMTINNRQYSLYSSNHNPKKQFMSRSVLSVLLLSLFSAFIFLVSISVEKDAYETKMSTFYASTDTNRMLSINISASNEYGIFSGAKYKWLENAHLAEPYKTTTFTVDLDSLDNIDLLDSIDSLDNMTWKWISSYDDEIMWGNSTEKVFKKTGKYDLYVYGITNNDEIIVNHTTTVIVKYVKRELRQLTHEDKHAFLHTAAKLWKYSTEEGRAKYGEKYTSVNELVEEHALASNDVKCDQFHEGTGFFVHHFAITQTFEAALRSIDPSITVPYWDFTIEGQQVTDLGEKPSYFLQVTPFLNDDWFGSVDENDHIQDSKFAFAKMPKATNASFVNPNSYGFIRSYWNNNNDEYVTRHLFDICGVEPENKRMPDCQTHFNVLNVSTLSIFQMLSPSDGHGTIHVQFGGMGGDCIDVYKNFSDTWSYLLDAKMTPDEIMSHGYSMDQWKWGTMGARREMFENMVMGEYFHVYRSLWRSHMCARDGTPNLLVCPESCDTEKNASECKCQVESLVNGTTDWENVYECILTDRSQDVFNNIFPAEFIKDMVYTLSTMSSVEGEMIEAASPADILFWVIHPTIERILSAKRVEADVDFGGTSFYRWPVINGSAETWFSYSYYTLEENENPYWPEAYTCVGHAANDSALPSNLPWLDGFEDFADTDGDGIITNWEYYLALDPNEVDGLDYIYDNFEWEHCSGKIE